MRPGKEPVAGFLIHLSPPVVLLATPPPAPSEGRCNDHTCPWWPYSSSKDFKTNAAMILIILFCLLFCALCVVAAFRYLFRRTLITAPPAEQQPPPKAALSSTGDDAQLEMPPTVVFTAGTKLAGAETECTICLSEFVEGEGIRVLEKCNHGFHVHCIQKWLISHSSCPTCRSDCLPPSSSDHTNIKP